MSNKIQQDFRRTNTIDEVRKIFVKDTLAVIGFYIFSLLLLTTIFSHWLAPYEVNQEFIGMELLPPAWMNGGNLSHLLGTDDIGRDIFSRLIYGLRYTFAGALLVVITTTAIGLTIGTIASTTSGLKSDFLSHFLDAFLSIPILLLAIIIATLMEPSLLNAILAITLASLPKFIHRIYLLISHELKQGYAHMLRLDGASTIYLIRHIVLPRISPQIIDLVSRTFTLAILDISSLSFIALGAQPPLPEWGSMIRETIDLMYLAPWLTIIPGIALLLVTLSTYVSMRGLSRSIEQHSESRG